MGDEHSTATALHTTQSLQWKEISGLVGGRATEAEGDWIRGVLLHDGRGGPRSVAEEDRRSDNQPRPGQPGEAGSGQYVLSLLKCTTVLFYDIQWGNYCPKNSYYQL